MNTDNEIQDPTSSKSESDPQSALISFLAQNESLITHDFYIQDVKVVKSYFNDSL